MNHTQTKDNNRKLYIDIIRLVAIILVLYNHADGYSFYLNYDILQGATFRQLIYTFLACITKVNVPLFLMVSGAIMLGKQYDYTNIIKKTIRFVLVLLIFEAILYIKFGLYPDGAAGRSVGKYIFGVAGGVVLNAYSYWFIYSYIGLLIMQPFLHKIAVNLEKRDIIALFVVHMLGKSFIPYMNMFVGHFLSTELEVTTDLSVPILVYDFIFFPLLGYYIENKFDIEAITKKQVCAMAVLFFLLSAISGIFSFKYGMLMTFNGDPAALFKMDYLTTPFLYILIKRLVTSHNKNMIDSLLAYIGVLSFGIYLFDPILKAYLYPKSIRSVVEVCPIIGSIVWILMSILVGGALTGILRKNKYARFLLG